MIAAVAAETEEIALKALDAIIVEYEPIPGVFDPVKALENSEILARSDLESNLLYQLAAVWYVCGSEQRVPHNGGRRLSDICG